MASFREATWNSDGNVNSVDQNDGMERWSGLLEWSTGLSGLLECHTHKLVLLEVLVQSDEAWCVLDSVTTLANFLVRSLQQVCDQPWAIVISKSTEKLVTKWLAQLHVVKYVCQEF